MSSKTVMIGWLQIPGNERLASNKKTRKAVLSVVAHCDGIINAQEQEIIALKQKVDLLYQTLCDLEELDKYLEG